MIYEFAGLLCQAIALEIISQGNGNQLAAPTYSTTNIQQIVLDYVVPAVTSLLHSLKSE